MSGSRQILISKLDEFIRKYYKNQLIKGVLYSTAVLLSAYLTVLAFTWFGEPGSLVRGILFFGFLALALLILAKYIAIPLLKLNKIGSVISHAQAAEIIGTHFSQVQDKLLNVLQLQNNEAMAGSGDLLEAGISQKMAELKPIPFTAAIDFSENRKYLYYALPATFIFIITYILWPSFITRGTKQLVNYQTYYAKEMPFQFQILNEELSGLQSEDYTLKLKVNGNSLPAEVFVKINGIEYRLDKEDKIHFTYVFKNLQKDFSFTLNALGFESEAFQMSVLPKPLLVNFTAQLIYPSYLNRPNEQLSNMGDIQIPQGTKVIWNFNTKNTDFLKLRFSDTLLAPQKTSDNQFSYTRRFMNSNMYTLRVGNSLVKNINDSVVYNVSVIPDQYPVIDLNKEVDSLDARNIYLSGSIKDDYGFSKLHLVYKKFSIDSTGKQSESVGQIPLPVQHTQVSQNYYYYLNASTFSLQPGDKIEYYVEVYDNDGVNGHKPARTQANIYKAPTRDEVNESVSKSNTEIKKELEESIKKAKNLQKDANELSKKLSEKTQMGYDEKKKLEDILNKQQELKNKIEQIKKENQQNNLMQNELSKVDESIIEKQQELEKLFDQLMTPEMKKLFEELQKAMDKLDKNQVQQKLEELKMTNKDLEKELDRNLELFKQLEVQQKMQNAIDKLEELKNKENALKEETLNNKNTDNKSLEQKQEEINKEFEKLKEELKDLQEKNNRLEDPNKLPDTKAKENSISKEIQKSSENLSKGNKKEAAKSQEKAASEMEEMQNEMESAMADSEGEKQAENAQALRQILENLLHVSFTQEELIKQLNTVKTDNPQYVKIPQLQKKLKDDAKIIEDSLLALSKRDPSISSLINREISAINHNMEKTVKALSDRNISEGSIRMQSSMTSVNNLALLLNESLEQKQNQMKQNMSGKSGKCKKPGNCKNGSNSSNQPSIPNLKKMQEQLNKQLEQLKKELEQGQKPGEKPGQKPGQQSGVGGNQGPKGFNFPGSSEQFAKMAAQQEAIRRQIQQLMDKLKNKGSNPGGDIADMMEQTEKELVNKMITPEMIKRQNDILTKLLESEKAEREREQDEKRKSNEAKNQNLSNPSRFLEYKRLKEKELELINTVPPGLTPYYKEKVNNYFNQVNAK